jgi:hypothetical protein
MYGAFRGEDCSEDEVASEAGEVLQVQLDEMAKTLL